MIIIWALQGQHFNRGNGNGTANGLNYGSIHGDERAFCRLSVRRGGLRDGQYGQSVC